MPLSGTNCAVAESWRWADGRHARLDALLRRDDITNVAASEALPEAIRVGHNMISKYRRGKAVPSAEVLAVLVVMVPGGSTDEVLGLRRPEMRAAEDEVVRAVEKVASLYPSRPEVRRGRRPRGRGGRQPA
jgi:hypothetical protein